MIKVKATKIIILLSLCFTTTTLFGQEFIWDIKFEGQFDNREYNKTTLAKSQTLFGARITPQIGIGWGHNSINLGTDLVANFGAKALFTDPTLLLYYAYNSKTFDAYMGVLPRSNMIGKYSSLFFSDEVKFYDQNIDGILLQYTKEKWYIEMGIDWCGFRYGADRGRFMIFSSGEYRWRFLFAGYNASVFHFASSDEVGGVVDNVLLNPYIGVSMSNILPLDELTLQVGWIQGLHKDRVIDDDFNTPGGIQIELRAEKWNIGIYNTLYLGNNQMPYYNNYGSELYFGNPFYQSSTYNRLEAYWHPFKSDLFDLKASCVSHYDGKNWSWQQLLTLTININKGTFKKRVKYIKE